jgi:hypothetical protein
LLLLLLLLLYSSFQLHVKAFVDSTVVTSQVRQTVLSRQHRRQMESQRSWTCSSPYQSSLYYDPPSPGFFFFFLPAK